MSTILLPDALIGDQRPRALSLPPSVSTEAGDLAIELGRSAGIFLDPWQELSVRCIFAEAASGRWASFEALLVVARQNGKGEVLMVVELGCLFLFGDELVLHSAHEFKTAAEAFLRINGVVQTHSDLRRKVARTWTSHGSEGIELKSGARLRFMARSGSSGRGFTADTIILDEAQRLPRSAMGALLPTLLARPNPHVIYAATVPKPEDDSEHIESVRDRGMAGDDPALALLGWLHDVDEIGDVDLDDPAVWAASNPALGYRVTAEKIALQRRILSDDVFAREHLSVWVRSSTSHLIDPEVWAGLVDEEAVRPAPVAFAVEVSPDRRWSSIGLAGARSDGAVHVQIVQSGKGTAWLPDRLAELVAEWKPVGVAVDPSGPAGSLVTELTDRKIKLSMLSTREYGQACGMFVDRVDAGTVHHSGQPLLAVSLGAAQKRKTGESWVWRGPADTDISPLKAVTLALFVLAKSKKAKRSPTRVTVMR